MNIYDQHRPDANICPVCRDRGKSGVDEGALCLSLMHITNHIRECHSERSEESLINSKRGFSQRYFAPLNMTALFEK